MLSDDVIAFHIRKKYWGVMVISIDLG